MAKKDTKNEEQAIVDQAIQEVGKETLRVGIDSGGISKVDAISTRALSLDIALGVGGVPRGRIIEVFGPEGSGKTTLCLSVLAQCQANGGRAAFIDVEHALDPTWCRTLGVDTGKILFSQPDTAEQIFKLVTLLLKLKKVDLIVIDSVAAMITEAELAGEVGDKMYPETAKLIAQELRKLKGEISKTNTCVVFTNQIRVKLNSPIPGQTDTPGGRALKFYASQRMDIRRTASTKQGNDIIGSHVQVKVVKNKVAPPFKIGEFDIFFDKGISRPHELVGLGLKYKILERSGSWINYGENRLGMGVIKAGDALMEQPETTGEIEGKIRDKLFPEIQEAKPTEEMMAAEG